MKWQLRYISTYCWYIHKRYERFIMSETFAGVVIGLALGLFTALILGGI